MQQDKKINFLKQSFMLVSLATVPFGMLFDHTQDLGQTKNIFNDSASSTVRSDMMEERISASMDTDSWFPKNRSHA